MNDKEFPEGLIFKLPRENAPDYVIGSISIKRAELIAWLEGRDGDWVNLNLKRSQGGKGYAEVDTWKPQQGGKPAKSEGYSKPSTRRLAAEPDDTIPF